MCPLPPDAAIERWLLARIVTEEGVWRDQARYRAYRCAVKASLAVRKRAWVVRMRGMEEVMRQCDGFSDEYVAELQSLRFLDATLADEDERDAAGQALLEGYEAGPVWRDWLLERASIPTDGADDTDYMRLWN